MTELMHILDTAVNAVIPVVLLVLLGYCLRRVGFLTEEFARVGNKVSFNVALPCMLFINVYSIESFDEIRWDAVIYCVAMLLIIFILGLVVAMATTSVPERRGVILQATFRSNNAIVGLSLASVLGGEEAVAVAAIVSAFGVPVMNILAVLSLTIFVENGEGHKFDIRGVLKKIARNPLIIAICLGMVCLLIRGVQRKYLGEVVFALNKQLKFLYNTLNNIKSMASPFALIVLGAQFNFASSKGMLREIVVGCVCRVVIAPLAAIGMAVVLSEFTPLLNFGVNEYPSLVGLFGTPAAVSSAIMAGQMKNDQQLATQLVVWTSIASIFTMFLTVCLLMAGGFLAA